MHGHDGTATAPDSDNTQPQRQGSSTARRISQHPAGDAPAAATLSFTFDGQPISAQAGDTVADALWLAGVRRLRTMPEGDTPRGLFCGVGRCTDCLLVVDHELSVRACFTPVREGMVVETMLGLGTWKVADVAAG